MSIAEMFTGRFKKDGSPCKVEVFHNAAIDLQWQMEQWLLQTDDWTSESFARYVKQKNIPGVIIKTRDEFNLRK